MEYDLTEIIINIKNKDKISISYIQRTFSYGFNKSNKIFHDLIEEGYIDAEGKVNKKRVDPNYIEGPKVIFLDVDGVLNCFKTQDRCQRYIGIEDNKVKLLKNIVDSSGASIVLVSTWKEYWSNNKNKQDALANYLDKKLAKQGLVIKDKTIDEDMHKRGEGIIRYIEEQKGKGINVEKYVILDDMMFDYSDLKIVNHLVKTDFYLNGLEEKHVKKAIKILS